MISHREKSPDEIAKFVFKSGIGLLRGTSRHKTYGNTQEYMKKRCLLSNI